MSTPRATSHNVRVVCRVRPTNQKERNEKGVICVKHDDKQVDITVVADGLGFDSSGSFTFDRVFGGDSKQVDVFEDSAAALIGDVMLGYNATIFAYGQTGAGKVRWHVLHRRLCYYNLLLMLESVDTIK